MDRYGNHFFGSLVGRNIASALIGAAMTPLSSICHNTLSYSA
jgi:hypothetical protein